MVLWTRFINALAQFQSLQTFSTYRAGLIANLNNLPNEHAYLIFVGPTGQTLNR